LIQRLPHEAIREATIHRVVAGGKKPEVRNPEVTSTADIEAEAYRLAYAEGYEAGESDGLRDARQRTQSIEDAAREHLHDLQGERTQLSALVAGLNEAMAGHGDAMEALAFELALESMARSFGELQADRQLLQRLCRCVAEEFRAKAVSLAVSVPDRPCLPEHIEGLPIIAEPGLAPGECRLFTERGQIESSISQRLSAIHEAMQQALGAARP
jgi:flagellar biosynthesis/type III secretory pathway protein FliH